MNILIQANNTYLTSNPRVKLASAARYAFNDDQTYRRAAPLVPNSCSAASLYRTGCLELGGPSGNAQPMASPDSVLIQCPTFGESITPVKLPTKSICPFPVHLPEKPAVVMQETPRGSLLEMNGDGNIAIQNCSGTIIINGQRY